MSVTDWICTCNCKPCRCTKEKPAKKVEKQREFLKRMTKVGKRKYVTRGWKR